MSRMKRQLRYCIETGEPRRQALEARPSRRLHRGAERRERREKETATAHWYPSAAGPAAICATRRTPPLGR